MENRGGWVRLLNWPAHPLGFRFLRVFCIPDDSAGQRVRLLGDARLSPQRTRGVPGKGNRDKARRYTQTELGARDGEAPWPRESRYASPREDHSKQNRLLFHPPR